MVFADDVAGASEKLLADLQERAKELSCLYEIEEILARPDLTPAQALQRVVDSIAPGMKYPAICVAVVTHGSFVYASGIGHPTRWVLRSDITVYGDVVGQLSIYYTEPRPEVEVGPFLDDEVRLANTIAERLGHYLLFQRLRDMRADLEAPFRRGARSKAATGHSPTRWMRWRPRQPL